MSTIKEGAIKYYGTLLREVLDDLAKKHGNILSRKMISAGSGASNTVTVYRVQFSRRKDPMKVAVRVSNEPVYKLEKVRGKNIFLFRWQDEFKKKHFGDTKSSKTRAQLVTEEAKNEENWREAAEKVFHLNCLLRM